MIPKFLNSVIGKMELSFIKIVRTMDKAGLRERSKVHAMFEISIKHSNEDVKQAIGYSSLEHREKTRIYIHICLFYRYVDI